MNKYCNICGAYLRSDKCHKGCNEIKHVVSFSGGLGSWACAKRVAEKHGTDNLYLVFTDVLIEDEDLYTFLPIAAKNVGGKLVIIKEGRNPWEVFRDVKYQGNTRVAHCSGVLKSDPFYKWIDEQGKDECIIYLGIDWNESHRLEAARKRKPDYHIEAPLCEAPYLEKRDIFDWLKREGIELPRLYKLGLPHNNCSGGCVKAGLAQWAMLYKELPEKYSWFEQQQEELMRDLPQTKPFLRKTVNGVLSYPTLKEFRESLDKNIQYDLFDFGGCGCFSE